MLSIFDGSTCYCPDCIGERFSIFTPEETTEVVETVSSGAGEQVFEAFFEIVSNVFNSSFGTIWLISFGFVSVGFLISLVRRVINGE